MKSDFEFSHKHARFIQDLSRCDPQPIVITWDTAMNQDSEKCAPPSSPNPKGFKDFFRRKHKLSGSGSAFEGDDSEMDSGQVSLKTPKSKDDNSGMCEPAPQSYGII